MMEQRWIVNLCPFLHFDNARTETYEHNISIASWNVKSVLDYLEVSEFHTFGLDQASLLEGFERLFPNYLDQLKQTVLEGRVELLGGTYVMPDLVIPDGESLARQFLHGTRYFRENFGVDVRTGWGIDSVGHCSQLPQILRQCGIGSYFFCRGMPYKAPSEFVWKGPDGSHVNAVWLPRGYSCASWLSENTREAFTKILDIVESIGSTAASKNLFIPVGGELIPPLPHLNDIVNQWNKTFPDMRMVIVTPQEFTEKLKSFQAELPVITGPLLSGRFSSIYGGSLSSRVKLKLKNRELEGLVYLAEVFLSLAEDTKPHPELENVWRILLFNQDHNILRGTIADEPYLFAKRRYEQAIEKAQVLLEEAVDQVASRIDRLDDGQSYAVFNPLSWSRTDIVRVPLPPDVIEGSQVIVEDSSGLSIPCQVSGSEDTETGVSDVLFLAEDIPSLGYRVFTVKSSETKIAHESSLRTGKDWIESRHMIVEFDGFNGTLTRVYDKRNQFELLSSNANCLTLEADVGDLYRYSSSDLAGEESVITSLRSSAKIHMVESGPLRAVAEVRTKIHGCPVKQRINVYEGISRIDLETDIDFKGQDRRVALRFPLSVFSNEVIVGAQFAAERRQMDTTSSSGSEPFAALDWVDCSGPDNGVMVSAPGVHEFQFRDGVLSFTLFRSVDHLSRGLDDKNLESSTARENGHHSFRYCISSHKGDWKENDVWRVSTEHRLPLIAYPLDESPSDEPLEESLLSISGTDLALTCFKPTEQESQYVIRFYEPKGESGKSELKFDRAISSVTLVDFCEKDIGHLTHSRNSVEIPVDAHSIITLRITFADEVRDT
ncbi:hypothetical protein EU538_05200 [Candidatus Thorarchaeota archaeon]|nr:MAG: hypothetical protein EU538_05200 [Candidatus Thorarchaeota archaeon]